MNHTLLSASLFVVSAVGVVLWSPTPQARSHKPEPAAHGEGTRMLGRLPVAFVPNLGQWDHDARYVAKVGAMTVFLQERGWSFVVVESNAVERKRKGKEESRELRRDDVAARGVAVRMTFAGAEAPELVAERPLPGRHNYFPGNDSTRWRSDVPLYGSVRYRGMHDGVDVLARGHGGHFEYDLLLAPGADLAPVEVVVEGAERLHVGADGALVMTTAHGPVRMPVPVSWEEAPSGEKTPVACQYELRGASRFGFVAPERRPGWALVVDPGLVWSTFLGGSNSDAASACAIGPQGDITIVGDTSSVYYPTTLGAFQTTQPGNAAFVTKLTASGASLVYSTFLGGSGGAVAYAVALDSFGGATIAGSTNANFPTTPGAYDTTFNGQPDAFVTRLTPAGSSLVYSTYLGGSDSEGVNAIDLDVWGAATVAGFTRSSGFPTTAGAFDTTFNNDFDVFVTRLSPTGAGIIYSTFLGGTQFDQANAIRVDSQGATTITGMTYSFNFPVTAGAFDTAFDTSSRDAFVCRLSPSGASLLYSTFLGGTGDDVGNALALDAQGNAIVAGFTAAMDFPATPGVHDTSFNGGSDDAFVALLSPTGTSLLLATFLGGSGHDTVFSLAPDAHGTITCVGATDSPNFPTTPGAFDTSHNGGEDAFVIRLSPTLSRLDYSTFLGGANGEEARAIALDAQGAAIVVGFSGSASFPTTPGAYDPTFNGGGGFAGDAFVARLDMLPTGVSAFGTSSPGCSGPLAMSVTSKPFVGNLAFSLTCGNAAATTVGLIAFTSSRLQAPVPVLGVDVWLDPTTLLASATVASNALGACDVPLPIPANPALAGYQLFTQFLWLGPTSPAPCPAHGFSASNALAFTIQA